MTTSASQPEPVDLERASPAFRTFYHAFFEDTMLARRSELDWRFVGRLTPEELVQARSLIRAHLGKGRIYLEAAALLNDRAAIPVLHAMLDDTRELSAQIGIAASLWCLERSPAFPALIEQLVRSSRTELKEHHIWDILGLADIRTIDHLFTMLDDSSATVRELTLFHLAALSDTFRGRLWNWQSRKTPEASFFKARRTNPRFIRGLLRKLQRTHELKPLVAAG